MWKPFTVHHFTVIKNLNCGIKQTNFETSCERIHCKMKRAKLTPKAKLAPMSWGPVWTLEVRFGLFKLKRVGQVPFRPLQNLNWPKWILLWNFFSIWPFQELCRIYQFWPPTLCCEFFKTSIDDSENISDYENLEVTSAPKEKGKSPKDLCFTDEATELSIV